MDSFTISSFLHMALRIFLVGGLVTLIVGVGERAIGLDIRSAVDAIEKRAQEGDVWPLTSLLLAGVLVLGYILG